MPTFAEIYSASRASFTFDADGNQEVSIHPPLPKRVTVTWDFENRPVEYRYPDGGVVALGYDAENRLVDWESDSVLGDTLLWDGKQILQERREELGPKQDDRFYTLEPAGFGNLVSERREVTEDSQTTEQTLLYHYDALGSTRQLVSGGETVGDFIWDAWGFPFASFGTTETSFAWIGELGYYYFNDLIRYHVRRRVYEPGIARWTAVDPIQNGLLYGYANNSPVANIDPSGLRTITIRFYYHWTTLKLTQQIKDEVTRIFTECFSHCERTKATLPAPCVGPVIPEDTVKILWIKAGSRSALDSVEGGPVESSSTGKIIGYDVKLKDGNKNTVGATGSAHDVSLGPALIRSKTKKAGKPFELGVATVIAHEAGLHEIGSRFFHIHLKGYVDAGTNIDDTLAGRHAGGQIGADFSVEACQSICHRLELGRDERVVPEPNRPGVPLAPRPRPTDPTENRPQP